MGMTTEKDTVLRGFSSRLNEALERMNIPRHGRAVYLADRMNKYAGVSISRQSASKWLSGANFPQQQLMIPLSELLNVNIEWLFSGKVLENTAIPQHDAVADVKDSRGEYSAFTAKEKTLLELFRDMPSSAQDELIAIAKDKRDLIMFRELYKKISQNI